MTDSPSDPRVEDVLAQIRSGVRQRQGELAALGSGGEAQLRLVELRSREFVEEPVPVSPRPVLGRLLVFLRKAAFHLGFKWYVRPVLQQQNDFNRLASGLIQDQAAAQERLARAVESLSRRLAEAERRLGAPGE